MASNSVARTLEWLHEEEIPGFEHKDVMTTVKFIDLHNDALDILNSRRLKAPGFKAAVSERNIEMVKAKFDEIRDLYENLTCTVIVGPKASIGKNMSVLTCPRKTGFVGMLTAFNGIECIASYMESKKISLSFLCCYKLLQDFLEIFFNAGIYQYLDFMNEIKNMSLLS